jgi:16S rRNA C967 or C1407 C5-methylase (RsmB/RsmF family)/NOL1/NOP2/fmu family ribosome biogenesis protein
MKPRKRKARRGRPPQPSPQPSSATGCVLPGSLDLVLSANEQRALAEAVLARPLKAVRLRPDAAQGRAGTMPLPFATEPVPWFTGGRFCIDTHQPGRFLAHAAGDYFVQDAGSMLALALMDPQPGEWVADVCGAPGAKATALLEVVGPGGGFLLANEPVRGRLPPLAYNLARVGFSRWLLTATDPERFEPLWQERFHAVLVDAPCTGQALVGRGKQSQAAFTAAQVAHSAARQQRILAAAAALVQPGGRLVYSTCTFAPEENEQVITSFLAAAPDWQVEELPGLAAWRSPLEPGGYRLYPHRDRCAGSYAIRLRHTAAVTPSPDQLLRSAEDRRLSFEPLTIGDQLVGQLAAATIRRHETQWEAWPVDIDAALGREGRLARAEASEVAYRPGKHWMPAHALAMRREAQWQPAAFCDLDDEAARAYLQGHALPAGGQGWCVARWQGRPLGWLRGNSSRLNNGLPPAARLTFPPLTHTGSSTTR